MGSNKTRATTIGVAILATAAITAAATTMAFSLRTPAPTPVVTQRSVVYVPVATPEMLPANATVGQVSLTSADLAGASASDTAESPDSEQASSDDTTEQPAAPGRIAVGRAHGGEGEARGSRRRSAGVHPRAGSRRPWCLAPDGADAGAGPDGGARSVAGAPRGLPGAGDGRGRVHDAGPVRRERVAVAGQRRARARSRRRDRSRPARGSRARTRAQASSRPTRAASIRGSAPALSTTEWHVGSTYP